MTTMEVIEQLLRLETEMLVLYAKIGEFEARLEILEKDRYQNRASPRRRPLRRHPVVELVRLETKTVETNSLQPFSETRWGPTMITVSKWRYAWNGLAVFLAGWFFGHQPWVVSWFRPVTTIFVVLALFGLLFVLWEDNKEIKNRRQ